MGSAQPNLFCTALLILGKGSEVIVSPADTGNDKLSCGGCPVQAATNIGGLCIDLVLALALLRRPGGIASTGTAQILWEVK